MPRDPDKFAIWGDWDLERFRVCIAHWRDTTHPPPGVFTVVDRWWKRLAQPQEWQPGERVSPGADPEQTLRWTWVPHTGWVDEHVGAFRVQCYFRVFELDTPPRIVCEEFVTVPVMTVSDVDRADGLG
ncbi:hypothetical protein [Actinoplanes sp. NBRC 101535]|uniref:hypothetical protein n=1 Tax=Actinoplanes sp. NBRC 101535 TaxID=3032196 RepID=UPI0024A25924|nr:hypothetical protein [Actinoplanes sp. NBRC 101535]GLY04529.1 hypothetical protein Acsp01_49080 [Actinoplanes sp. NBRC 101535]